ncbi:MAG: PAS domain S-box protein [Ignavibacteria bacterium]|jgi:PAS domain S-box-containing protein
MLILYYFNRQKENIAIDIKKDLSVVADLKVKQIENWRDERLLDGLMISENKIMVNSFLSFFKNNNNGELKNNISDLFKSFCDKQKYLTARLVDFEGNVIISYPSEIIQIGKKGLQHIKDANDIRKPFLSDFHFYENTENIHIDLVIPIIGELSDEISVFLMLEIDPNINLYPIILSWPAESKTGETLLIKKENEAVVYLNELRHIKSTALKLKFNLEDTTFPSVKAVNGITGITDGLDYRKMPVIAFIKSVPGTNWYMIAKIDKDEVFEDINRSSISVAVLIVFVISVAGFSIFLYWSKQKEKYLKSLLDSDRKRIALISHFDSIIKNANDVFILYDDNTNVIEVNEKAISLYGYTKEEFLKLNLNDLRAPDVRSDINDTVLYVKNHPDGLLFETRHIKKDRMIFPVESSTRYIQLGDRFLFQSVVRDITERKQAERALLESEQKFSTAFRLSPEAIIIVSAKNGKYVDVNETFVKEMEYKRGDVIGKTIQELDTFFDCKDRINLILNVKKRGYVYGRECKFKTRTGKILTCLISSVYVHIGNEQFYISSVINITDRKIAEEKIEYLNRIYALLSQINQAIVRIDNKQELFDKICNIAIEFGKFSFAWIGLLDEKSNRVLPVAFDGFENGYLDVVKNSSGNDIKTNPFLIKFFTEGKDIVSNDIGKDNFHVYDRDDALKRGYKSSGLFPIRENGKVIGLLCLSSDKLNFFSDEEIRLLDEVAMDISFALDYYIKEAQREETNEALNKSEKKFRTLFDNAGDAILLLDDYKFIEFNKIAERVFEFDRNNLLFKSPIELSPDTQPNGIPSESKAMEYMKSAYSGKLVNFEWLHKKSDGTLFETEVTLNSVYIGSKKMLLAVVHDISERKKYEKGLKAAIEKAEEMNRIKSSFLANMSHELRTPMTGILGFADILSKSLQDPEQREMADVIYKDGIRLTNTLNMILDLSKIEAEKIEINYKPTKLSDLITNSVKLFEVNAKSKNILINTDLTENIYARVDERLLEQVLSNLIKNSLIYTNEGSITIKLSKHLIDNCEYAEIKVIDTGIGIPENSLDLIFEPFRQVSEGWTRSFEGTGLGLTISKKYVEMMNGSIKVESKLNKGTTFTLLFKAFENCIEQPVSNKNYDEIRSLTNIINKKNTLLVEDDELTVITITKVLKDICNTDVTNNGVQAIKMAKEKNYDVILMDIGLKGMDGLEATKEIRKISGYEKLPIVAITAYAMAGDKEKFFNGGCSHYISKPFSNETLRKLIAEL